MSSAIAPLPVPVIPESAPFSLEQRAWLNGFLAGIFSRAPVDGASAGSTSTKPAAKALQALTILFGTQTGTCETLAKQAAKEAGKRGFAATVLDLGAVTFQQLAQQQNVLVITSTYGDGEPPDNAKALHAALTSDAPTPGGGLSSLRYSVCGLGDTNYTLFCQCSKDFDAALEKRGATRISPRVDCDTDYETPFAAWLNNALACFGDAGASESAAPASAAAPATTVVASGETSASTAPAYGKKNPFPAPVLTVRKLNGAGSAKEVNHVEFSLEGSGLVYEAGDALAVVPHNCPELVNEVLGALGRDGTEAVATPEGELDFRTALTRHFDLGKPTAALLDTLAIPANARGALHHVIDALLAGPLPPHPVDYWVTLFRKIAPRLYSISSSPKAHPGHVHLTVGTVRYEAAGRARKGVCSTFLAERALHHGTSGVFVHANKAFRPPVNPQAPMIMIGPGTGIAPFRAFLQERAASGASGKNWLFFGDQKASTDFLYREELDGWQASGVLTRLDTAFSRDQAQKVYVQQRMLEQADEFYAWLEAGASVYVCGDASRMAKDVDQALHQLIQSVGLKTAEEAAAYVQALKAAKRYQRDVY